ncbi:MAG: 16S rRNA (guanine(966)-N(2))-methyltransferase RsmD [Sphingomonadaceae bacterium]
MRIIAGQWRSRRLEVPPGTAIRPTADRVRETLFSMLVSRLGSFEGLRVADLFAGSGALALEALSRGAAQAVLVEQDAGAARAAEANLRALGANARVLRADATRLPRAEAPFDLLFLDPPYGRALAEAALASAVAQGWLAPHALACIETGRGEPLAAPGFRLVAERSVGKAHLRLVGHHGLPSDA